MWADGDAAADSIALVNQYRVANGVNAVLEDANLSALAAWKGQDMATRGYFAHTDPDGKNIWAYSSKFGVKWSKMGENLGKMGPYGSLGPKTIRNMSKKLVDAFMAEVAPKDGHKKNMLSASWKRIGAGVAVKNRQVYLVHVFAD
jgi:uncharacterized protein YkwD